MLLQEGQRFELKKEKPFKSCDVCTLVSGGDQSRPGVNEGAK